MEQDARVGEEISDITSGALFCDKILGNITNKLSYFLRSFFEISFWQTFMMRFKWDNKYYMSWCLLHYSLFHDCYLSKYSTYTYVRVCARARACVCVCCARSMFKYSIIICNSVIKFELINTFTVRAYLSYYFAKYFAKKLKKIGENLTYLKFICVLIIT